MKSWHDDEIEQWKRAIPWDVWNGGIVERWAAFQRDRAAYIAAEEYGRELETIERACRLARNGKEETMKDAFTCDTDGNWWFQRRNAQGVIVVSFCGKLPRHVVEEQCDRSGFALLEWEEFRRFMRQPGNPGNPAGRPLQPNGLSCPLPQKPTNTSATHAVADTGAKQTEFPKSGFQA